MSLLVNDDHDQSFYRIHDMEARDAFLANMKRWRKSCRVTVSVASLVWVSQLVLVFWYRSLGMSMQVLFSVVFTFSVIQFMLVLHVVSAFPWIYG
ncbi:hypothetical protein EBZ80_23830 [bacterium]|nr:hypothetical protein [bacterium]